MNWYDYTRGFDDGRDDCRMSQHSGNLLFSMVQLAFNMLIVICKLCFFVLAGFAAMVWAILKAIAGRHR